MITSPRCRIPRSPAVLTLAIASCLIPTGCGSSSNSGGTGGVSATGGAAATGGVSGTGGALGTGGATLGTGGAIGTGGSPSTGGVTGTGGGTATGGAAGSVAAGGNGGGRAAGGAAGGGVGAGGATSCAGRALSLGANTSAADPNRARVMVDLMTDLPVGNTNRTLEYWAFVRTADWVGEFNTMFEYGNQSATAAGFGLDFGTNPVMGMAGNHATLDPYTNGGFDGDSTNDLGVSSTTNQWVHFAMVWNGTNLLTYVNGVLRITTNGAGATMLATARTPLTIGCNNPRFSCFGGYIDEFRVWNVARTANQIMGSYNHTLVGNETGLVGYWKFDDAAGSTTAVDSVTTAGHTAHPGTLMAVAAANNPTFITPTPPAPILCP